MRAVVCQGGSIIHLSPEGNYCTKCGHLATKNAPTVVHRLDFCLKCFGPDRGVKDWSASRLGLQKICEVKSVFELKNSQEFIDKVDKEWDEIFKDKK